MELELCPWLPTALEVNLSVKTWRNTYTIISKSCCQAWNDSEMGSLVSVKVTVPEVSFCLKHFPIMFMFSFKSSGILSIFIWASLPFCCLQHSWVFTLIELFLVYKSYFLAFSLINLLSARHCKGYIAGKLNLGFFFFPLEAIEVWQAVVCGATLVILTLLRLCSGLL